MQNYLLHSVLDIDLLAQDQKRLILHTRIIKKRPLQLKTCLGFAFADQSILKVK